MSEQNNAPAQNSDELDVEELEQVAGGGGELGDSEQVSVNNGCTNYGC
ncbi:hypothetical protein [Longimicrobium sp.]